MAVVRKTAGNMQFCAIGADGSTIIGSAYPGFILGGRNSAGH